MTIAVSAVSVAVVTVAVSNSGLIRDWPQDKEVLGNSGKAEVPASAEPQPTAYLVTVPEIEPSVDVEPMQPAATPVPVPAPAPANFTQSFATLQQSEPMPLAAAPAPTVLLFDSTAFVPRRPALVTPPPVAPLPSVDPVETALAIADTQPPAELVWKRPAPAELPAALALTAPLPPLLSDPLARVEGIADAPLGDPSSEYGLSVSAETPAPALDRVASPARATLQTDLGPSLESAALSLTTPPPEISLEAVEGIGQLAPDLPDEATSPGPADQSARLRRELSASLARLREREARPVQESAKQPLQADEKPEGDTALATPQFEQATANVVSGGTPVGAAAIRVDGQQMVSIQLGELISLFEQSLDKPLFVWLKNSGAASQFATLDTLRSAGIDARYDPDTAQVSLSLMPGQ